MKNKNSLYLFLGSMILLLISIACSKTDQEPKPTGDAPSNLVYSPNAIRIIAGETLTGAEADVEGTTPIVFSLEGNTPSWVQISSSTGAITVNTGSEVGTYSLDIKATNDFGSKVFTQAYTIEVVASGVAPFDLKYSPDFFTFRVEGGETTQPTINGSETIKFKKVTSEPDHGGKFTINESTGVISVGPDMIAGDYYATVTAENSFGVTTFEKVVKISIELVSVVTFNGDIKPLLTQRCGPCHTSGQQAQAGQNWSDYEKTKSHVDAIIRSVENRSMPPSGSLNSTQIDLIKKWKTDGLILE